MEPEQKKISYDFTRSHLGGKHGNGKDSNGKHSNLRKGFTTGSAATAAAKCALYSLIHGKCPEKIKITTLNNLFLDIAIACSSKSHPSNKEKVFHCGVRKDSGDDPDVTNNLLVMAEVTLTKNPGNIEIKGGHGVGTVKKPGLPVKVDEAAINPEPKKMITNNLLDLLPPSKGVRVTIFVPDGQEVAKKTLNEKLGIINGISILGTTGIVEPFSLEAYKDSLYVQLYQIKAFNINTAVFTPGKIGENNAKKLNIPENNIVFIGNFVGHMLSRAIDILDDDCNILIFGHLGKLSKVAAGIFQTHSKIADARREIFVTYTALNGGDNQLLGKIFHANTTEEMLTFFEADKELKNKVMDAIAGEVTFRATEYVKGKFFVGTVLTDRDGNVLAACKNAQNIFEKEGWKWLK